MKNSNENSQLQIFAKLLIQVPIDFLEAANKYSEDEDHKLIIAAFAPSLKNQFLEISNQLNEEAKIASPQILKEVEALIQRTAGVQLVQNFKISLPSFKSLLGKLGIKGIIIEIKKIIEFILGLFKIKLTWVKELLLIINEIIDHILGGSSVKTMNALSRKEVNYLEEIAAFSKAKKASTDSYDDLDEE